MGAPVTGVTGEARRVVGAVANRLGIVVDVVVNGRKDLTGTFRDTHVAVPRVRRVP